MTFLTNTSLKDWILHVETNIEAHTDFIDWAKEQGDITIQELIDRMLVKEWKYDHLHYGLKMLDLTISKSKYAPIKAQMYDSKKSEKIDILPMPGPSDEDLIK